MRKYRGYILKALAAIVTAVLLPVTVSAHGGRTDSQGGHNSPSGYHYHHGYPAHQHYNGKCPFETEVKTDQSGTTAKSTAGVSASSASENIDSELSLLREDLLSCNEELVKQMKYKERLAVAAVILSGTIVILSALLWMQKKELNNLNESFVSAIRDRNKLKEELRQTRLDNSDAMMEYMMREAELDTKLEASQRTILKLLVRLRELEKKASPLLGTAEDTDGNVSNNAEGDHE